MDGSNALNTRDSHDLGNTKQRQRQEPNDHDGPKTVPMPPVPRCCTTNTPMRMTTVIGTTNGLEDVRRRHAETFNRAEHRDRRRNHAVAVQERGETVRSPRASHARSAGFRAHERNEREDAAFPPLSAFITNSRYFDRDCDDETPDDQRQHADDVFLCDGDRVFASETFAERERAGADVAIDDAESGQREKTQRGTVRANVWSTWNRRRIRSTAGNEPEFDTVGIPGCRRCRTPAS